MIICQVAAQRAWAPAWRQNERSNERSFGWPSTTRTVHVPLVGMTAMMAREGEMLKREHGTGGMGPVSDGGRSVELGGWGWGIR